MAEKKDFVNYPTPLEGPYVTFKRKESSNPVIRGWLLEVGASIISNVSILQKYLYWNNGFSSLRAISDLDYYEPRYDPTVIPIVKHESNASAQQQELPVPARRASDQGYYTSADYRALYLAKQTTPTAVVQALLPLIRRDTTPPGEHSTAFLDVRPELILKAAAESTRRYEQGRSLGPLDGVPIAVKDEVDVAGYSRTLGSCLDFTEKETSWCVKALERAGAVIVGKTNMHEFGLDTTNNNPHAGTPRNPHNPGYYTGGSSGGSGYAVSAGLVPIAHGADGGGSIRLPSNYCGIYGLKPTHGRISASPTPDTANTTVVHGPMAATLDDLAVAYRVMAAPDPENQTSRSFPDPVATMPSAAQLEKRPKILGVFKDWVNRSDPVVLQAFKKCVDYYEAEKGYTVVDISIPYIPEGQMAHALTILAEISSTLTAEQISRVSAANKIMISVGNQAGAADFMAAQRMRSLLMRHLAFLFQKYPGLVIVTPTTPTAGAKIVGGDGDLPHGITHADASLRSMEYVYLANFTGCPAISCPVGYEAESEVPIGLMGMGEWGSEEELIAFARDGEGFLEGVTGTKGAGVRKPKGRLFSDKGVDWVDVVAELDKTESS